MVDAIVSAVLEQLISVAAKEANEGVRLAVGVGQEVEKLKRNFQAIQAVLHDAEHRQVREEGVRLWLDQLKDASYNMEDVLDEWITARLKRQTEGVDHDNALVRDKKKKKKKKKKVCSFFPASSCFGFKQVFLHRDIALKIKAINQTLDDIAEQKDMFSFNVINSRGKSEGMQSTSLIDVSEVRGRDEEMRSIKSMLLCQGSDQQTNTVQIISMVGMGGIGKTTLAQLAYNDNDVINNFEIRVRVCVSDPFDEFNVAKATIEELEGSAIDLHELNSLLRRIGANIAGQKFFMVLDNLWTDDYRKWEPFRNCLMNGLRGSKILITTRKETVARMMESTDIVYVQGLSELECWSLFRRFALSGRTPSECDQLEGIGRGIVRKCKGLPLAAKTIGSLLQFKRTKEEWQSALDSEMWQLEEFEGGLSAPLFLSYNDLPFEIKRCFSYCAIFPKSSYLKKDELVKLWMAQGYIVLKGNNEMKVIGLEYFDCLASRSFYQQFVKDDDNMVIGCTMHDVVHDFAQSLTNNECVALEVHGDEEPLSLINNSQDKLRHSISVLDKVASFPVSIFNAKKLRSLLIRSPLEVLSPVLKGLFDQLTCLRTFKIDGEDDGGENTVHDIPREIEKLIHLRSLRLAGLKIEELPETCCKLFNLQTLDINECYRLKRLPQGVGSLVNLRHLVVSLNGDLDYLPKGLERLTSLRTLREFVVSSTGGKYGTKACMVEGLRQLNHLRGTLRMRGLGNVTDVEEAEKADLEKKKNIVGLELRFDKEEDATEGINEENEINHQAISEALRPPPDLEALEIMHYKGKTAFPSWIVSLNKLKKLKLSSCCKCEIMPPLGELPSFEILQIERMESVKRVGVEFLGIESFNDYAPSSSLSLTAFPKLKELTLFHLDGCEEWDFGKEDVTIMPQLCYLDIRYCRKLKSLPDQLLQSSTLEKLRIIRAPILRERFKKDTGEDWSKISHIRDIQIDHEYGQGFGFDNRTTGFCFQFSFMAIKELKMYRVLHLQDPNLKFYFTVIATLL
ncbi:hypothetical protein KPL70_022008 [Citrus sinensis]|nr:hypothetical protein KPL70_022008 [Citrus sinensis]